MKIYITGAPGSGKTTLAREISRLTGVKRYHLDEVMHEPDPDNPGGNRKRDPEVRDRIFQEIISRDSWIIEDAGRKCFSEGQAAADRIVVLDMPKLFLLWRVSSRHIKQLMGIEKAAYKADMTMLMLMRKWVVEYHIKDHVFFPEKAVYIKNKREISAFLSDYK